jgi:hypothetical protein
MLHALRLAASRIAPAKYCPDKIRTSLALLSTHATRCFDFQIDRRSRQIATGRHAAENLSYRSHMTEILTRAGARNLGLFSTSRLYQQRHVL